MVAAGLTKQYGEYTAVNGIHFTVPKGKCFGFLGPNGAGKTTTLRMILGVTPKSSCELTVFGLAVPACAREIRARIGVVPILDHGSPGELISRHVERDVIEIQGENAKEFSLAKQSNCRLESMGTSLYCYTNDPSYVLKQIQNNHGLTYLHRPADLEDVFLKLTGRELRD